MKDLPFEKVEGQSVLSSKMLMTFQATQGDENASSTNSFSHAILTANGYLQNTSEFGGTTLSKKRPFFDTTHPLEQKVFFDQGAGDD